MPVGLFVEDLTAFPPERMRRLQTRLRNAGLAPIEAVYALLWPDYLPPNPPRPQDNRAAFATWRNEAGVPLWGWLNATGKTFEQEVGADALRSLDTAHDPDGWKLDIEGEWSKGAKLNVLLQPAADTGKPRCASLAGATPAHVEYDFRALDLQGYDVDWQSYPDTGEGPDPATAISELHKVSFVIEGWQYRHRVGDAYGWGKVVRVAHEELAQFDSYLRPNKPPGQDFDAVFGVLPREEWGFVPDDRILWPAHPDRPPLGLLMGRFPYARTRVTLDIASRLGSLTPLAELEARAARARSAGARKRPVDVYLAERDNANCDRIFAICQGAA